MRFTFFDPYSNDLPVLNITGASVNCGRNDFHRVFISCLATEPNGKFTIVFIILRGENTVIFSCSFISYNGAIAHSAQRYFFEDG